MLRENSEYLTRVWDFSLSDQQEALHREEYSASLSSMSSNFTFQHKRQHQFQAACAISAKEQEG